MNAYIASFMLLVFNAVGLVVPATEAVAEERILPDANANFEQNGDNFVGDISTISQRSLCVSSTNSRFDVDGGNNCQAVSSFYGVSTTTADKNYSKLFVAHHASQHMSDKLYVEGAP